MAQSRDEIETRIESMAKELADLRRRVLELEVVGASPLPIPGTAEGPSFPFLTESRPAEIVGLAGRSLVVLGGAFLLRAVSAAALLPDVSGPLLGLLYAALWIWQADRSAARGQRTGAFFHGLSGLAIASPLIWEATSRFHLLPGLVAGPAVVAFLGAGLLVSFRRDLRLLSWASVAVSLATTLALLLSTREFVLYTAVLVALAGVVEWFGIRGRWPELRWGPAAVLDLVLALLAVLVSQPRMSQEAVARLDPGGILVVSLLAPVVYLGSVATATLWHRRAISGFELVQVAASLLFGIGTALVTMAFHGGNPVVIAAPVVLVGAVCYAVAFRSIDAAEHPRLNFYAYSSFAGILVAVGTALLLDAQMLAWTWLVLGVAGAVLGVRHGRNTLRLHGALYLAAASFCSGLATVAVHGLVGPLDALWIRPSPPAAGVMLASMACYAMFASRVARDDPHWSGSIPRLIVAAVALTGLAGLLAPWLTGLLLAAAGGLDRAAYLATVRTCLLSTLAAALAWGGRRWSLQDLAWLVYPLMAANGVRLLWEDLRYGDPVNLFLAFGFYGGALIVASRMQKQDA
ncbi:MAG: hypothetical protein ABR538_00995 [Candidatus Binatia bacterium]